MINCDLDNYLKVYNDFSKFESFKNICDKIIKLDPQTCTISTKDSINHRIFDDKTYVELIINDINECSDILKKNDIIVVCETPLRYKFVKHKSIILDFSKVEYPLMMPLIIIEGCTKYDPNCINNFMLYIKLRKDFNNFYNNSMKTFITSLIQLIDNDDLTHKNNNIDIYEIIINQCINNIVNFSENAKSSQKLSVKKKPSSNGVGYATNGSSTWEINDYVNLKKNKQNIILNNFKTMNLYIKELHNTKLLVNYIDLFNSNEMFDITLPKYISTFLKNDISEIVDNFKIFEQIFSILSFFNDNILYFGFFDNEKNDLLMSIHKVSLQIKQYLQKASKLKIEVETAENLIISFYSLCDNIIENYIFYESNKMTALQTKNKIENHDIPNKNHITIENQNISNKNNITIEKKYSQNFENKLVNLYNYNELSGYFSPDTKNTNNKKGISKILKEITSLENSLPNTFSSCIFINIDESNVYNLECIITGPNDTPYDSGCFHFKFRLPFDYPSRPPLAKFMTVMLDSKEIVHYAGEPVPRFNPNLYNDGKVCLSLLGTWEGQKSETWNSGTSSLLQLMISIQASIFTSDPFYNEPGYDKYMNTPEGDHKNAKYNHNVKYYTMKYAILNQLKNPTITFRDQILDHFRLKKEYILKTCEEWVKNETVFNTNIEEYFRHDYQKIFDEIKNELNKL